MWQDLVPSIVAVIQQPSSTMFPPHMNVSIIILLLPCSPIYSCRSLPNIIPSGEGIYSPPTENVFSCWNICRLFFPVVPPPPSPGSGERTKQTKQNKKTKRHLRSASIYTAISATCRQLGTCTIWDVVKLLDSAVHLPMLNSHFLRLNRVYL